MYRKLLSFFLLLVIFLFPMQAFAADYTITDFEINAYLQEDGTVFVEEQHTYDFDGEFGGIIRSLIPNTGAEIRSIEAFEGDTPLQIEVDFPDYRIHRSGNDETITIDLQYEIIDGVTVYEDVADFYWSFFDKSNPSTYENLTINVFPPEAIPSTDDVIAFGYDEAFQTENILQNGQVQFAFGKVPSKENGDIRVAYDASLFPTATNTSAGSKASELEAAHQEMIDAAIARAEQRETVQSIGNYLLPVLGLIFLFFISKAWLVAKRKHDAINRELDIGGQGFVPQGKLSMPATIVFTNHQQFLPETAAAALLDLVRKGHVKKLEENQFELVDRHNLLEHEELLVSWLFDEIGENELFSFEGLEDYTKIEENSDKYYQHQAQWQKAVKDEIKKAALYENKWQTQLMIGVFSLVSIGFGVFCIMNDLIAMFFISLVLTVCLFTLAISYRPHTWEGSEIILEWQKFKKEFTSISGNDWQGLSEDDKMRAFIYSLGINEKKLKTKNESLINAFQMPASGGLGYQTGNVYSFDPSWLLIGALASSSFKTANSNTSVDTSSSSGGFGGGGGAGGAGGGGGSGAF
ncbi:MULTISPECIES: DUF2207 domain-containing protein [Bacillaceae]|uniref:DUF2207 domain-containing protein n=1 Tax=Evansella alkalicola TaxID=745819 RepID=A0ABS6JRT2_9BACI|nr:MULTISPECIES: DUF2207 domain-containing protein [Bacillaceae]MBU9721273.1 DUF2207 domain-containing protein [Bacillus alkalicola]